MARRLRGVVRHYDWGSHTAIPKMLGVAPDDTPWAELWLGAHRDAPAVVEQPGEPTLDRLIAADPQQVLGPEVAARHGSLPFLVKVLAAQHPLSLQLHPSAAQATQGFVRENRSGVPLDAAERVFTDPHHKPELLCALDHFELLCGVRDPAETLRLLRRLDVDHPGGAFAGLHPEATGNELGGLVAGLLRLTPAQAEPLVGAIVAACSEAADDPAARAVARLGRRYPRDPAVIVALLCNHVVLAPGEALLTQPGVPHSYLRGTAVEVMANSDNVVRGGLTSKAVDVDTFVELLEAAPGSPAVARPSRDGEVAVYPGVDEFELRMVAPALQRPVTLAGGPAILLCTSGTVEANSLQLCRGQVAWVDATESSIHLRGSGTVFCVTAGAGTRH